jgi:hypothetical protein
LADAELLICFTHVLFQYRCLTGYDKEYKDELATDDQVPRIIEYVIRQAAIDTGVDEQSIELVGLESVDWPDAALGVPEEGVLYAQMITPGYRVTLRAGGRTLEYHTDTGNRIVRAP